MGTRGPHGTSGKPAPPARPSVRPRWPGREAGSGGALALPHRKRETEAPGRAGTRSVPTSQSPACPAGASDLVCSPCPALPWAEGASTRTGRSHGPGDPGDQPRCPDAGRHGDVSRSPGHVASAELGWRPRPRLPRQGSAGLRALGRAIAAVLPWGPGGCCHHPHGAQGGGAGGPVCRDGGPRASRQRPSPPRTARWSRQTRPPASWVRSCAPRADIPPVSPQGAGPRGAVTSLLFWKLLQVPGHQRPGSRATSVLGRAWLPGVAGSSVGLFRDDHKLRPRPVKGRFH